MRSGRNRELGENRDHAMITIFLDAKGVIIDSQLDFGVCFFVGFREGGKKPGRSGSLISLSPATEPMF